ncbi:reverse transcriptase zinc-binding domain-containing protein [Tanacetum coccineum]
MDSNLNNQNDQWELNLDIDDFDLILTPVLRPCSSTRVETSTITQKQVRIIPGPTGDDEDFKSESWVSATEYVDANGGIVSGCLGDIKNFLKNGKLDQVVAIVKSCFSNVIGDLTVTLQDLSVFSPKPSMHYLNITMRNVVKVFRKDTVPESGNGVGGSGMLMEEEEIVKLIEEEEMVDLELQVCGNITDQEMIDEEALNLALEEEARQARAKQEWLKVVDSSRLQDRMKVWFVQKCTEEEAFARFLRDQCVGHRMTNKIVARDYAKLEVLEQLLAGTNIGIGLKDSYVADMEENE